MLEKGLVQIYTGDGKGKTTAAFGLALRAAGYGHKVLIYQFLKPASLEIGERFAIMRGNLRIRVEALDVDWRVPGSLQDKEKVGEAKAAISRAVAQLAETAAKGFYDVLVLDEIVFCLSQKLAEFKAIKELIAHRDPHVEIIMTGRGASEELVELADLVTEMKNVKHPFDKDIRARAGIEF